FGDSFANRGVRDTAARACYVRGRRRGGARRGATRSARRNRGKHILNRNPSACPGAVHSCRVDRILSQQPPHGRAESVRGELRRTVAVGGCRGPGSAADAVADISARRDPAARGNFSARRKPRRHHFNAPQHVPRSNLLLLPLHNLPQDSRAGGGNLHRHLVRLDLNQRLVLSNRFANLFQPPQDLRTSAFGLFFRSTDFQRHGHETQTLANCRMVRMMRSGLGTAASSNTGLWGLGMSGMVRRSMGASRLKKASLANTAAISAPKPAVTLSSCTTRQRRVFSTDAITAGLSQGESVRRSITSTSTPDAAAACSQRSTIAPQVTMVS